MELTDNKHITKAVAKQLAKDDWTMETLATAYPPTLTEYKGVGKFKAQSIVEEAQRLVSEQKLQEADPRPPKDEQIEDVSEQPAVSVRVRRIKERGQQ